MNLLRNRLFSGLVICAFLPVLYSCKSEEYDDVVITKPKAERDWRAVADSSTYSLVTLFWNGGLKYFNNDSAGDTGFQYWPQAHALDVLTDAYLRTENGWYLSLMNDWFIGVKQGNGSKWKNTFFDDMEWIALAQERAYRATKDPKFLDAAKELWGYISVGWNDTAGGGIAWKQGELYKKNACSNGPACILACRLYEDTGDEAFKEMAIKIFEWEKATLLENNIILDHIDGRDGSITNWKFTYNQGTFIGSGVELYKLTGDKSHLNTAMAVANNAMATMSSNSVLKLEGSADSSESNDSHLFKGIFIRYLCTLATLEDIGDAPRKRYTQFVKVNAEALWTKGTVKPQVRFGPDWCVPPGYITDLKSMVSGCTLLESVAMLMQNKLL